MTTYITKFTRAARTDNAGFTAYVTRRFGTSHLRKLLDIAVKLDQPAGATLDSADLRILREAYPNVDPGFIASAAAKIHALPASMRGDAYLATLVGDPHVMAGNMHEAGDDFREVRDLANAHATATYAEAINAKRGGSADASPAWRPEPGSVRDIIEQQFVTPQARRLNEAYEAGDPQAEAVVRHSVAKGIDDAAGRLEQPDLSTRETVEAAFDLHQGNAIAADHFGAEERQ